MKKNVAVLLLSVCLSVVLCLGVYAGSQTIEVRNATIPGVPLSLQKSAAQSLKLGTGFLLDTQARDGSWHKDPAITALVVYSLLLNPGYNPDSKAEKAVARGLDYIEGFVQPDGGIYRKEYRNYVTAVCLMALCQTNEKKYRETIARAKDFLIRFQLDDEEGIDSSHPHYGGIGYGGDDRPDMSNTQIALGAIKEAEAYEERFSGILKTHAPTMEQDEQELGLHWQKALVFINRCQNSEKVNDMPYAGKDGGFIYETGLYKKDRSHSYGSMTYAGVKSLLYANVDKHDPRVAMAVDWICNNYTLDFNPGFGTYSLFYYYMTFGKCLAALDEEVLVDALGQEHWWRQDLLSKLVSLQREGGYWQNPSNRYWEHIKPLSTAYSIIAMKFALAYDPFLGPTTVASKKQPAPAVPAVPVPSVPAEPAAVVAPAAVTPEPPPAPEAKPLSEPAPAVVTPAEEVAPVVAPATAPPEAPAAPEGATHVQDVFPMEDPIYKKHKKGIVVFTHKKHAEDYGATCGQCHHDSDAAPLADLKMGDPVDKCSACHSVPGMMSGKAKRDASDSQIMEYHAEAVHENCRGCHKAWNKEHGKGKGEGAPVSCAQCHPKK